MDPIKIIEEVFTKGDLYDVILNIKWVEIVKLIIETETIDDVNEIFDEFLEITKVNK